jgi:hypothetical protein
MWFALLHALQDHYRLRILSQVKQVVCILRFPMKTALSRWNFMLGSSLRLGGERIGRRPFLWKGR